MGNLRRAQPARLRSQQSRDGEKVIAISMMDLGPLLEKYGITSIVDMYHSGLEHTFLWVVETTEPHNLEEFSIEFGHR